MSDCAVLLQYLSLAVAVAYVLIGLGAAVELWMQEHKDFQGKQGAFLFVCLISAVSWPIFLGMGLMHGWLGGRRV